MRRKLSMFCVICTMIMSLCTIVSADTTKANNISEERQIEYFLNSYFESKYKSLAQLKMEDNMKCYFTSELSLDYLDLDTLIKFRKIQDSDLRFSKYTYKLNFIDINISNDTAKVILNEEAKIFYDCSTDIESEEKYDHMIDLEKLNNRWIIKKDNLESDFKEILSQIPEKQKDNKNYIQKEQSNIIKKAKINIQDSINLPINNKQNIEQNTTAAKKKYKFSSYDRNKAKAYALKYALKPNPSYPFYSKGGDCTNFTSQCLKAGGIVEDKEGKEDSKLWFRNSTSWKGAQPFHNYWRENKGSTSVKGLKASKSSMKGCRLGDIVQKLPWNSKVGQYTATHSVIISGYVPNPTTPSDPWNNKKDVFICQHSDNKKKIC